MNRVVILGPGGSGKSVLARQLGARTGLPVIELDTHFWSPSLEPLGKDGWAARQVALAAAPGWIMDGDLGPYDVLSARLARADTVLILALPLWVCVGRALRRGFQPRLDFWWWLLTWRARELPRILSEVHTYAPDASLHILRTAAAVDAWLTMY